jgi:hypothetical protein
MKRFWSLLLAALLSISMFVGCGAAKPVTLKEEFPTEVNINTDLNFKDYYQTLDGAKYNLYVSYVNPITKEEVTEEKLRSKIYSFEFAGVYTFKLEQVLDEKSSFLEVTIECLPDAPKVKKGNTATVKSGQTRTWVELIEATETNITPSDLIEKAKFSKVSIVKAAYATTEIEPVFELEEEIAATATDYTFEYEGVYTFEFSVENKKGTANGEIVISAVDAVRASVKPSLVYSAAEKTMSWEAIEGATGYRVQSGDKRIDVETNSVSFADWADDEYSVTVFPIYDTIIYPTSAQTEVVYVGKVLKPLILDVKTITVSWAERPFAVGYEVKENGGAAVSLPANVTSYKLQGTNYQVNYQVKVEVVAVYDATTKTQVAETTINYGTITLKGSDLTWPAGVGIAEATGIEGYVIADTFTQKQFIMVEFTGKNAPNYAFRAQEIVTEIRHGASNAYWSKAGIMYTNSFANGYCGYLTAWRGFGSGTTCAPDWRDNGNTVVKGEGAGMSSFKDGVKYIQIVGYEVVTGSDKNAVLRSVYSFAVNEDGSLRQLTLVNGVVEIPHSANQLTGTKTIVYANVNNESVKTGDITFTCYPVAETLAGLIDGSTSPYKAQLKALLNF